MHPRSTSLAVAFALATLLLHAVGALAVDPAELPDPKLQARYIALTHEFRCVQCQNETLADSEVSVAADLRREIRGMLLAGKSDQQIRDYMVSRYSEFILFRPRYSLRNAWLWLLPFVVLAVGVLVAWRVVRARVGLVDADDAPVNEDGLEEAAPGRPEEPGAIAAQSTPRA
jgi:cytochrome c-type biogenesis protein CcmH